MKSALIAAAAAAVLAVPAFALGESTASGSTTSGGIMGTIYVDYNSQYCSDGYTKYQLLWNRADWDRLNTSWLVRNPTLEQRSYGMGCGTPGNFAQKENWQLTPNDNWGNTGDQTHALGGTRYVDWTYQGMPMYPDNSTAWAGAHLFFQGADGTYITDPVCAAANIQDWPC